MVLVGSDPIARKQTIGMRIDDSIHISSTFRITPSANLTPIDSEMYFRACGKTRSGHQDLWYRQQGRMYNVTRLSVLTLSIAVYGKYRVSDSYQALGSLQELQYQTRFSRHDHSSLFD